MYSISNLLFIETLPYFEIQVIWGHKVHPTNKDDKTTPYLM